MFTITGGDISGRGPRAVPILATAIHDGHELRQDLLASCALSEAHRGYEEDPRTGLLAARFGTSIVVHTSRFEVDLNRPRSQAVYRAPEDAWGLDVWHTPLTSAQVERSLALYDAFYGAAGRLLDKLERRFSRFVVLDLHSYNHRRLGPEGPPAGAESNPVVNVGTGTMADRQRWAEIIDRFAGTLRAFDHPLGPLDVRENVKFAGGQFARWVHQRYPQSACVLSVEIKKVFMDEWTGGVDVALLDALGDALCATVPGIVETLSSINRSNGSCLKVAAS